MFAGRVGMPQNPRLKAMNGVIDWIESAKIFFQGTVGYRRKKGGLKCLQRFILQ